MWRIGAARRRMRWEAWSGSPSTHGRFRYCAEGLLHLLIRVDAPEAFLRDPAVEAGADHAAPGAGAGLHRREHAGLQLGGHRGLPVGLGMQRDQLVLVL